MNVTTPSYNSAFANSQGQINRNKQAIGQYVQKTIKEAIKAIATS